MDKKEIKMSSAELYQHLLSITCRDCGPPDDNIFAYKLTPLDPSLFQDEGILRKSQKSILGIYIVQLDSDILMQELKEPAARVIDCCALLHQLA